jgi:hypothetical protein
MEPFASACSIDPWGLNTTGSVPDVYTPSAYKSYL